MSWLDWFCLPIFKSVNWEIGGGGGEELGKEACKEENRKQEKRKGIINRRKEERVRKIVLHLCLEQVWCLCLLPPGGLTCKGYRVLL